MAIYDVTVPIRSGMPIYEGDPPVKIEAASSLARGDSANVSFLRLGAHTGTHVDAPAHFIEGAAKIDSLSLDILIGQARVIHVPEDRTEIDFEFLSSCDLENVERIIFRTRNSGFWESDFRKDFTHLLPEAAEMLVNLGVKLVGTDYLSIEKFHSGHHRTHIALLAGILFPVFAQARAKAQQVTCCSNLRQIGMAIAMYREDYGYYVPAILEVAQDYNTKFHSFPTNMMASMFRFKEKQYFHAQPGAEKPPAVNFNFGTSTAAPAPATK